MTVKTPCGEVPDTFLDAGPPKPPKRVFCKDCRHRQHECSYYCFDPSNSTFDPIEGLTYHTAECKTKNAKCDCSDYSPRPSIRLAAALRRLGGGS